MSHTLHRQGNVEELEKDFVVFGITASGINSAGSKPKLVKVFDILAKHNPVNIGDSKGGSRYSLGSDQAVRDVIVENELVHAVFRDRETVIKVLRDFKDADLGLSIVVSGLLERTTECCSAAAAGDELPTPHTIVQSLGIWGNTSLLPEYGSPKAKIATMCGHGLVSFTIIDDIVTKVKAGKITAKEGGEILAKPCICGIFNPPRAAELINEFIEKMA